MNIISQYRLIRTYAPEIQNEVVNRRIWFCQSRFAASLLLSRLLNDSSSSSIAGGSAIKARLSSSLPELCLFLWRASCCSMLPSTPVFSPPCRTPIIKAVAVPDGNLSFSRMMTSLRRGTANKTPKKHNPKAHKMSFPKGRRIPVVSSGAVKAPNRCAVPSPGISDGLSRNSKAGTTPTNPHPKGIVPTDPATVCTRTFSTSLNPSPNPILPRGPPNRSAKVRRPLKYAKPIKALGMAIPETHPVCRPKYVLENAMRTPIMMPASTARKVNCGCSLLRARKAASGSCPTPRLVSCSSRPCSSSLCIASFRSRSSKDPEDTPLSGAILIKICLTRHARRSVKQRRLITPEDDAGHTDRRMTCLLARKSKSLSVPIRSKREFTSTNPPRLKFVLSIGDQAISQCQNYHMAGA